MATRLNPFDPETQNIAAVAWAEQLEAGVQELGLAMFEDLLHEHGMCSEKLPDNVLAWFEMALEVGAVAMGMALLQLDRIKEES